MPRQIHNRFDEIKIHTAKCDNCNKHNTLIIYRCMDCGQQCCTPCWLRKGGDDNHVLNGGDKGFVPRGSIAVGKKQRPKVKVEKRVRGMKLALSGDNRDDGADPKGVGKNKQPVPAEPLVGIQRPARYQLRAPNSITAKRLSPFAGSSPPPVFVTISQSSKITTQSTLPYTPSNLPASKIAPGTSNPAPTLPPSSSTSIIYTDHDGILALLHAAEHLDRLENASSLVSAPLRPLDTSAGAEATLKAEIDDEEWGQDAQARSPLFVSEDMELTTQSDGGVHGDLETQLDETGTDKALESEVSGKGKGEERGWGKTGSEAYDDDDDDDEETEDDEEVWGPGGRVERGGGARRGMVLRDAGAGAGAGGF